MKLYLDASFLIPLFADDDWTDRAGRWASEPDVILSDWVVTEFSSALSLHVRKGRLDADERDEAENALNWWLAGRVDVKPSIPTMIIHARALLHRHAKLHQTRFISLSLSGWMSDW